MSIYLHPIPDMAKISEFLNSCYFFLTLPKGAFQNLPGVENDERELTEVLTKYKKEVFNNSKNVLEDLKECIEEHKQQEFERVHFHYSGKIYQ